MDTCFSQSIYTFTGTGNWSLASNWTSSTVPPAVLLNGSEIIIDPISTGECVLDVQQTISSGATLTIKPNKKFRVIGNLTLNRLTNTSANLGMLKKVNGRTANSYGGYSDISEEFEYNSDTLVSKRTRTEFGSVIAPSNSSVETYTTFYFYAPNDKKPYKDSTVNFRKSVYGTTTSYSVTNYSYDIQDKITKSESFNAGNLLVRKVFSYVDNKRIENWFTNAYGSYTLYVLDTFTLNLQNEIIHQDHYFAFYNGDYHLKEHKTFTYDTEQNPYATLNIMKYGTFGTDSAYNRDKRDYQSVHNLQSISGYFEGSSSPYQYDYVYIYDDKHFPISRIETYRAEGYLREINFTYEYY